MKRYLVIAQFAAVAVLGVVCSKASAEIITQRWDFADNQAPPGVEVINPAGGFPLPGRIANERVEALAKDRWISLRSSAPVSSDLIEITFLNAIRDSPGQSAVVLNLAGDGGSVRVLHSANRDVSPSPYTAINLFYPGMEEELESPGLLLYPQQFHHYRTTIVFALHRLTLTHTNLSTGVSIVINRENPDLHARDITEISLGARHTQGPGITWFDEVELAFTTAARVGDYNRDGFVDSADYSVWRNSFGMNVGLGEGADGNSNGEIDAGDYAVWRDAYSAALNSGIGSVEAAVPEPSCAMLLATTIIAVYSTRFRFTR